jgi:hypothetical protein
MKASIQPFAKGPIWDSRYELGYPAASLLDMGIDDESSHPELCSEVAGGVTHNIVSLFREPDP